MLMNTKQIQQIIQFLSAYPADVVEAGIEAWRTGDSTFNIQDSIQGIVTDTPLAQNYNELTAEEKKIINEKQDELAKWTEEMKKIMPYCKCGKQLRPQGVCPNCPKGKEGYKSKLVCSCGYEEFFKTTINDKIIELKKGRE